MASADLGRKRNVQRRQRPRRRSRARQAGRSIPASRASRPVGAQEHSLQGAVGLGVAIDKRIAPTGIDALQLLPVLRDVNKDVPDNPGKVDTLLAAILKLKRSLIPLTAEVASQVGFR